jgi:hypothetical protein
MIQLILYYLIVSKYEKKLKKIVDIKLLIFIILVYAAFMVYSMIFYNNIWARGGLLATILLIAFLFYKRIINAFQSMRKKEEETI